MSFGAERLGSALIDSRGEPEGQRFIHDKSNYLPTEAMDIQDFQPLGACDPSIEADSLLRSAGSIHFSSNGRK